MPATLPALALPGTAITVDRHLEIAAPRRPRTPDRAAGLFRRAVAQSAPGTFFSPELAADITAACAAELGLRPTVADLSGVAPRRLSAAGDTVGAKMDQGTTLGPARAQNDPLLARRRRRGPGRHTVAGPDRRRRPRHRTPRRPHPRRAAPVHRPQRSAR